jgi:undecaprenyl diphosphate synthase
VASSLLLSDYPEFALDPSRIPRHVAIVMDGNGRWAGQRGLARCEGHRRGKDSVRAVVELAREIGIEYLTLFLFSSENWQRPPAEVRFLMQLFHRYLVTETKRLMKRDVRVIVLGDTSRLPLSVRQALARTVEITAGNHSLTTALALSYVGAARRLAQAVADGRMRPDQVDDAMLANELATSGMPDPDLLIRTSGELRISNFMLFQLAYTELYFTDTLWPDFRERDFLKALAAYQARDRRFGTVASAPGDRLSAAN